mgnify:CR=1 FL=1
MNETAEYTAIFIINQASIDGGGTSNTVTVTASSLFGTISDVSDNGDDTDGNTTDDPTVNIFSGSLELEATKTARDYMIPFPPSSPCIALFKNGELVHMLERHHIEGRPAELIAENLKNAYNEYC